MILQKAVSSPFTGSLAPRITTSPIRTSLAPSMRVSTSPFTGSGAGSIDRALNEVKKILMSKYGLTSTQADSVVRRYKAMGKIPSPEDLERMARDINPTFGTRPKEELKTIPQIDKTLDPIVSTATGFNIVDPTGETETFFQKNKMWIIPVGAVAVIGGIYLLTKKKK